ncbi:4174_t:CDS:2, partial [Cetraspora pellucida]
MDHKRTHIPRDTVVVSRKSIFEQFNYDKTDEINSKRNIEKRLFERLREDVTIEVFRLFARDPPTKVSLKPDDSKDYSEQAGTVKARVDEPKIQKSKAKRLKQIIDTMVTSSEVIMQSKIPWERNFVPHKVLHVPFEDPKKSP